MEVLIYWLMPVKKLLVMSGIWIFQYCNLLLGTDKKVFVYSILKSLKALWLSVILGKCVKICLVLGSLYYFHNSVLTAAV